MVATVSGTEAQDFDLWASWFKCLADPTRLRILNYVSSLDSPVTVGQIVEHVGLTQSNVSRHLQILAAQEFVLTEPEGVRTMVSRNELCMTELPEAVEAIMGRPVPGSE